jgi:hypothetical protein
MRRRRTTKVGVEEWMDEPRWQSPSHQISIEIDTPRGIKRIHVAGTRSQQRPLTTGPLTDRKIDKYLKQRRNSDWLPRRPEFTL